MEVADGVTIRTRSAKRIIKLFLKREKLELQREKLVEREAGKIDRKYDNRILVAKARLNQLEAEKKRAINELDENPRLKDLVRETLKLADLINVERSYCTGTALGEVDLYVDLYRKGDLK